MVTRPQSLTLVQQTELVVKLYCAASGVPLPTVRWTRNGLHVTDGKIETRVASGVVNSTLVLKKFIPGQSIIYSCEAQNTAIQRYTANATVGK